MGAVVYFMSALTVSACAGLLLRGYARAGTKLLLWGGLCFAGLAVSNALIFIDLVLVQNLDLYRYRLITASVAMILLLYGLIWESNER